MTSITPADIDHLNEEAWNLRINDTPRAQQISDSALRKSRTLSYERGKADALRTLGFCSLRMSNHKDAKEMVNRALDLYQRLDDLKGQSTVYEYLGIIHRHFGDLAASLTNIQKALELSRETQFTENEITNLYQLGVTYRSLGLYEKALEALYESLQLSREQDFGVMIGYNLNIIGSIHYESRDFEKALENFREGLSIRLEAGDQFGESGSLDNIGCAYLRLGNLEKATHYFHQSFHLSRKIGNKKSQSNALIHLAEIQSENNIQASISLLNEALGIVRETGDVRTEVQIHLLIAKISQKDAPRSKLQPILQNLDSTLHLAEKIEASDLISETYHLIYQLNKDLGNIERALSFLEKHLESTVNIHKQSIQQKIQNLEIAYQAEQARKEAELFKLKNTELKRLNEKTNQQKKEIEETLTKLRETQAQLVHSEKMASLGELTAGIAHEIQNPLNFVNNFSEVSTEMIDELKEELSHKNLEGVLEIISHLHSNLEKITHHGKRADSIVKGMLDHSRRSTGKKELIEINALCDEYLRLAYHGLRARDKSFTASIETNYDKSITKIRLVPQDMGRVLLNIITNAFHAVHQKGKEIDTEYTPIVRLSTQRDPHYISIYISDNGPGIPQEIKDKIFQPFFTTKDPGQGTGLGLSLAYDIIKAHGGVISVNTKERIGAEFSIKLPIDERVKFQFP